MTTFRIIKPIGLTRLVIKIGKVVSVKRSACGRGHDGGVHADWKDGRNVGPWDGGKQGRS